ncbi:MAG: hypothetical protein H6Q77_1, partial [Gemmatimonadetes bacterium]|nr:hypothetical protein [Gemmatimonadota bacterium]
MSPKHLGNIVAAAGTLAVLATPLA